MKKYLLFAACLLIAACTTAQERTEREAQREIDLCTKAGYQPNTPAFDDCRQQVQAREEQREQDRIDAATNIPGLKPGRMDSNMPSSGGSIPFP